MPRVRQAQAPLRALRDVITEAGYADQKSFAREHLESL